MRWRLPHLCAQYQFAPAPILQTRPSVTPGIRSVFRCLTDILAEGRLEVGSGIMQVLTNLAEALALVIR